MYASVTGLRYQHVLSAGVARPAPRVPADPQQNGDPTARRQLGAVLDSGHVLSQREARLVPPRHRAQPAAEAERHWTLVVCYQVGLAGRRNTVQGGL